MQKNQIEVDMFPFQTALSSMSVCLSTYIQRQLASCWNTYINSSPQSLPPSPSLSLSRWMEPFVLHKYRRSLTIQRTPHHILPIVPYIQYQQSEVYQHENLLFIYSSSKPDRGYASAPPPPTVADPSSPQEAAWYSSPIPSLSCSWFSVAHL